VRLLAGLVRKGARVLDSGQHSPTQFCLGILRRGIPQGLCYAGDPIMMGDARSIKGALLRNTLLTRHLISIPSLSLTGFVQ